MKYIVLILISFLSFSTVSLANNRTLSQKEVRRVNEFKKEISKKNKLIDNYTKGIEFYKKHNIPKDKKIYPAGYFGNKKIKTPEYLKRVLAESIESFNIRILRHKGEIEELQAHIAKIDRPRQIITPFGKVTWESSPNEILQYLCSIESVKEIAISFDINNITNIDDSIAGYDALAEGKAKSESKDIMCNTAFDILSHISKTNHFEKNTLYQSTKIGENTYITGGLKFVISAKLINVNNINFAIGYSFTTDKDITAGMIKKDLKPLTLLSNGTNYNAYVALSQSSLQTNHFTEKQDNISAFGNLLSEKLAKKYLSLTARNSSLNKSVYLGDNGSTIHAIFKKTLININYNAPPNLHIGMYDKYIQESITPPASNMVDSL